MSTSGMRGMLGIKLQTTHNRLIAFACRYVLNSPLPKVGSLSGKLPGSILAVDRITIHS